MNRLDRFVKVAGRISWRLLSLVLIAGVTVTGAAAGWKLFSELRSLETQRTTLEERGVTAEQHLVELEQKHTALSQERQQLATDRDNLLAQTTRANNERNEHVTVVALYEGVLRRVGQENQALKINANAMKQKQEELEKAYDQLLSDQERLVQEQEQLRTQLVELQSKPMDARTKQQLVKEQEQHRKDLAALQEARKQLKDVQGRQAKNEEQLPQLHSRLEVLQEKYAKLLTENKLLKHRASRVPKDVTIIAREHEQLLKELADTHYNMGVIFSDKNDYVRAAKEFQKVLELKPDDAESQYNLGVIYAEHLPDREKATKYFRRYLQVSPNAQDASWVKQYIASWQAWEAKERLE